MERNHYVGRNLWGETFWMERNPFNGEKPFDWRETFWLVPSEVFVLLALWRVLNTDCVTQFSCNNCIHHFKTIKFHHIDKVKMKMQLRLTKFTFHLVGSNFIISTKVKMKMQLRLTKFTFHLVESNFIISTKVKMKMALLQEGHCGQWSLHKPSEINTCYKSLYDTVHVTRTVEC